MLEHDDKRVARRTKKWRFPDIVTATILLIRHAAHGHLGSILSGRTAGIPLTEAGVAQARALAVRLADAAPDIVQASPVQRAQETAAAIASTCKRSVETVAALDEIDFGEWTGRAFDDLAGGDAWDAWNSRRSEATPPGGESMAAAQRPHIGASRAGGAAA